MAAGAVATGAAGAGEKSSVGVVDELGHPRGGFRQLGVGFGLSVLTGGDFFVEVGLQLGKDGVDQGLP